MAIAIGGRSKFDELLCSMTGRSSKRNHPCEEQGSCDTWLAGFLEEDADGQWADRGGGHCADRTHGDGFGRGEALLRGCAGAAVFVRGRKHGVLPVWGRAVDAGKRGEAGAGCG